jgi:hypothetical protein
MMHRAWGKVVLLISSVIVLAFWSLYLGTAAVGSEYVNERATSTHEAFLINGTRIDLSTSAGIQKLDGVAQPHRQRSLLLVGDDDCGATQRILPTWKRFLEGLPTGMHAAILGNSGYGQVAAELVSVTRARQITHAVYKVQRQRFFSLGSGITSTPLTIVLDEGGRARMITNILTPSLEQAVRTCLLEAIC